MDFYLALILGFAAAAVGGELFVRGAVGLARWLRVPAAIIGATVAAFATSSPELTVSLSAALAGSPEIALGDALGSNIVNIGLVLAVALLISRIPARRGAIGRDFGVAVAVPVLTAVLIFDGVLSRFDAFVLLILFVLWLVKTVFDARRERAATENSDEKTRGGLVVAQTFFGLAFLILAGKLVVTGAKGVAAAFGIDEFIAGATIVALGTSMPELATAIVSKLRGHEEIGLGTILGSNIFNGLFIVGSAAAIAPISADWRAAAVSLIFGVLLVALAFPGKNGFIERRRGALLLALYAGFVAIALRGGAI